MAAELVRRLELIFDVPLKIELIWGHTGLAPVRQGGVMPLGRGKPDQGPTCRSDQASARSLCGACFFQAPAWRGGAERPASPASRLGKRKAALRQARPFHPEGSVGL